MIRALILLLAVIFSSAQVKGQEKDMVLTAGYFAPYGIQFGAKVGASVNWKSWEAEAKGDRQRIQRLNINPQLSYFVFPNVQRNILTNVELVYQTNRSDKRFRPMASVGLGYLLAWQRQDGTVNLSNGDITFNSETLHYFAPTLNIGFDVIPKKQIGYYLKGFYGRKFTSQEGNTALFGLELGLTYTINKKKEANDT